MYFSILTGLLPLVPYALANPLADRSAPQCNADNCLRAMRATQTPGRLAAANSFCGEFTTASVTAIPSYVPSECNASRISSACSCIATSTASTSSLSSPTAAATPTPFTLMALRSASPIHFGQINANGRAFWIGKATSAYCPQPPVTVCPPGNVTALIVSDGAAMDVEVPGGQIVYVAPNGALGYTGPHSASYPVGSALTGFTSTPGPPFSTFSFTGLGATGFIACPAAGGSFPYQIFAQVSGLSDADVPSGHVADCLGFDAVESPYTGGLGAWEYT